MKNRNILFFPPPSYYFYVYVKLQISKYYTEDKQGTSYIKFKFIICINTCWLAYFIISLYFTFILMAGKKTNVRNRKAKENLKVQKEMKIFPCRNCCKSYKTKSGLYKHFKKHFKNTKIENELAKKVFDSRWNIYKLKSLAESVLLIANEIEKNLREGSTSN